MKEKLNHRVPLCVGMPVKMGNGPYWTIVGYSEDWEPIIERKCRFFAYNMAGEPLFVKSDKPDRLTVPADAIVPVDGLLWFEEVVGGGSIPHMGFADLERDLDDELAYLNELYGDSKNHS